ncbi:hypothetical protein Ndes2437B_g07076 [Nannochloris sp. 'desiccata']
MSATEAIKRAGAAADAAETAATRLQIDTEDAALDRAADEAKDLVHDVREALEDIQDESEADGTTEEAVAKVAAAAKAVEDELKEVAEELGELTAGASSKIASPSAPKVAGESVVTERYVFKSTEQAVRELELLAKKKAKRNIQGKTIVYLLWALWAMALIFFIRFFKLNGSELHWSGGIGVFFGIAGFWSVPY